MAEERTLRWGDYAGEPNVITSVLIRGRGEALSQSECDKGNTGQRERERELKEIEKERGI